MAQACNMALDSHANSDVESNFQVGGSVCVG